jgi:thioredoxin reductase (NADPH)
VSRLARLFRRTSTAPPALKLLTRPGCHLCEEMKARVAPLVTRLGGTLTEVDVDADPALAARFGLEIPVLLDAEGRVVAKVRDDVRRIARRLGG